MCEYTLCFTIYLFNQFDTRLLVFLNWLIHFLPVNHAVYLTGYPITQIPTYLSICLAVYLLCTSLLKWLTDWITVYLFNDYPHSYVSIYKPTVHTFVRLFTYSYLFICLVNTFPDYLNIYLTAYFIYPSSWLNECVSKISDCLPDCLFG